MSLSPLGLKNVLGAGRDRAWPAGPERGEQRRHGGIRLAIDEDVDRRQALIVHAPAVVQAMIDRHLHDLGGDLAGLLEDAGEIEPIEAENDVGRSDGFGRFRRQHGAAGGAGVEMMDTSERKRRS